MMNKASLARWTTLTFIFLLPALACNFAGGGVDESATQTAAAQVGGEITPDTNETPSVPTEAAPAEPEGDGTPTPTVEHLTRPGSPSGISSFMTDRSSASLAAERRALADNFDINLLERPFTMDTMEYRDYLDIIRGELKVEPPWVYVRIFLEGSPPEDSAARYCAEIDLDVDGRGDFLVCGETPPSSEWTEVGVTVYEDTNNDVGGGMPMRAEPPPNSTNGYDNQIYFQGQGTDPDAAWIRQAPGSSNQIHLAFKYALIANDGQFLWGVWSDAKLKDDGLFDYNDDFSIGEAGSPAIESSNYPLKAMAEMDNSCRWAFGFEPTGNEIGVCAIPPTPTPTPTFTPTPEPSFIGGFVFRDKNTGGPPHPNGIRDSGESGIGSIVIELRSGSCSGAVLDTKTTVSSGAYSFNDLPPGTYCVRIQAPPPKPGPDSWVPTTPEEQTVTVGPDRIVDFGYQLILG